MKREQLKKILRGKCITDEACEAAIDELLNMFTIINRSRNMNTKQNRLWKRKKQ